MKRISIFIFFCLLLQFSAKAQHFPPLPPKTPSYYKVHRYCGNSGGTRDLSEFRSGCCKAIAPIDSAVTAFMQKYGIAGAQLAVSRGDSLLYLRAYGYADRDNGILMEPCHTMRIASVSKLLTAVGIMTLIEQGYFSLDYRPFAKNGCLRRFLPDYHDRRLNMITVEQILRHKSGLYSKYNDPLFEVGMTDARECVRASLHGRLDFTPGTSQNYSNVGYYCLGMIIEEITGRQYEEWMQQNIFRRLNCTTFRIGGNYEQDRLDGEVRYHMHPGAALCEDFHGNGLMCEGCYGGNNIAQIGPAGGWTTCAAELSRVIASIDGDPRIKDILSDKSIFEMTKYIDPATFSLGWNDTNEYGIWTRTGSFSGTTAIIKYFSADGADCWILLTNSSTRRHSKIAKYSGALITRLHEEYLDSLSHKDLFYE